CCLAATIRPENFLTTIWMAGIWRRSWGGRSNAPPKSKRGRAHGLARAAHLIATVTIGSMEPEYRFENFVVTTDPARLDDDLIHNVLSESYWAKDIPRDVVSRSIRNSLCFGVLKDGNQVGFARVITDHATFAYLADVFILEPYRERSLAKFLM